MSKRSWLTPELRRYYRPRVRQGARLLDRVQPGWQDEVKLGSLDLGDGPTCIVGQVFGNDGRGPYAVGLRRLTRAARDLGLRVKRQPRDRETEAMYDLLADVDVVAYGFQAGEVGWNASYDEVYGVLTELWTHEVAARRVERQPALEGAGTSEAGER